MVCVPHSWLPFTFLFHMWNYCQFLYQCSWCKWIYSNSWGFPSLIPWSHLACHYSNELNEEYSGLLKRMLNWMIVCTVNENPSSKFSRIHFRDLPLIFELFSLYGSFALDLSEEICLSLHLCPGWSESVRLFHFSEPH